MNRDEIIKAFEENYFIATDGTVKIYADDLVEIFTKHEQDTLKEFVVYLQSTGKYKAIDEYIDTMGISWGKRYMSANHQLNQDLENFLNEREG